MLNQVNSTVKNIHFSALPECISKPGCEGTFCMEQVKDYSQELNKLKTKIARK